MEPSDTSGPLADALLGRAEFTTDEVAREAGVEAAQARRLWRALGFPPVAGDAHLFTRSDIEILRAVRALLEFQSTDAGDLLQLTRVIGQSLARVADAQVTAVAQRLERVRSEATSREAALAELLGRIESLAPGLEQFLGYVWQRHHRSRKENPARTWLRAPCAGRLGRACPRPHSPRSAASCPDLSGCGPVGSAGVDTAATAAARAGPGGSAPSPARTAPW